MGLCVLRLQDSVGVLACRSVVGGNRCWRQRLIAATLQLRGSSHDAWPLLSAAAATSACRHLLLKVVSGSRWVPGLSSLTEFAFSMIEGMQSYYTYVEC